MNRRWFIFIIFFATTALFSTALSDTTPPSIKNVSWSPRYPNENTIITISATITDESGISWARVYYCYGGTCYPPLGMSGSGDFYTANIGPFKEGIVSFHISAQDNAGNIASTPEYSISIDGTPPNIKVVYPNGGEYISGNLTIRWEVSDNQDPSPEIGIWYGDGKNWYLIGSGRGKSEYLWNSSFAKDGNYLILLIANDRAGNQNQDTSDAPFLIDNTPPKTNINLTGEKNGDWFLSNVIVKFNATDALSGVKTTKYRIEESEWQNYSNPFELTTDGIFNITYYSVDKAGNKEEEKITTVKIDKSPPLISIKKPKKGYLYLFGREISRVLPKRTIIIGEINVEVDAIDENCEIERVEFYKDNILEWTDKEKPYEWLLNEKGLKNIEIKIIAYNTAGNFAIEEIKIFILNF